MNRRDVIEAFARRRGDAPVIVGPAGSARAVAVTTLDDFERELERGVGDGPFLIVARVEPQDRPGPGGYRAYPFDIVESAIRFRRDLVDRGLVPPIWAV